MHSFIHHHHGKPDKESVKETRGLVMNWGWPYDLMTRFFARFVFGVGELAFRRMIADLAQLQPGESVLDVGCGTGTLAMVAKERVGTTGRVHGIDPGPQQITRARDKAARRGLSIDFQLGVIEQLPFPDQSFDVVLSTLMMHHLPDDLKRRGLAEIARVLKPGGRLLIVDFKRSEKRQNQPPQLGVGTISIQELPTLIKDAGFSQIEAGETSIRKLGFAMGKVSKMGTEV